MMNAKLSLTILAGAVALGAAAQMPVRTVEHKAQAVAERLAVKKSMPRFNSESAALQAAFTVAGAESLAPVWQCNFDAGKDGWSADATSYVTWTTKRIGAVGTDKSFSNIDPDDVASLFVEGPYQTFRRETSSITSPTVGVPANGKLTFYVGFSQNYDDVCRLSLSVSTDGFATATEVWNSKDETGEKPWRWHYVTVDLAAWAGSDVQMRFTYGPGSSDTFNTGGYLGDFAIDGMTISGMKTVDNISVTTGETINLVDITDGDVVSHVWNMPGAVPATSTEASPVIYYTTDGTYDISLTVTDATGNVSTITRPNFVSVTGTAPVARIKAPATFHYANSRKPFVAPLAPVTFTDASDGFPTAHKWTFTGVSAEPNELFTTTDEHPTVGFAYLHDQSALLEVENQHGESAATLDFTVEYSGVACNMHADDRPATFDMQDWGVFPGSNTRKITAYAERFSKPSRPIMVTGAYVYFMEAAAEEVTDQIANVGVHLYTSKDGKPDRRIDSWWWSVYELDLPTDGQLLGTAFPFTDNPIIDDEFFIVVDGIPAYSETCRVSFGMADFRGEGGTAMMLKDGEWIEVSSYFPAGKNHTSFMIYPEIYHSVMAPLDHPEGIIEVSHEAGEKEFEIFSYLGYDTEVSSDSDWLRYTGTPNGMTVDKIKFAYNALPTGVKARTGHLTLTDGASNLVLTVNQSAPAGIVDITDEAVTEAKGVIFTLTGQRITRITQPGFYVVDGKKTFVR